MNQPTTKNWSAPIKAKYEDETRYFDTLEEAEKWLEEMEAKDLATTEPPPTEARAEPRTYWLTLDRNGFPIDAAKHKAVAETLLRHKWPNLGYRIIEVQEIQAKEPQ